MAKRFTDTNKWSEDWFLDLPLQSKLFWIYVCDNCNHAGIFKPNKRLFEILIGTKIDTQKFLELINTDKKRIIVLGNGRWYILGFIEFQYGNKLNSQNRVHNSILKILNDNDVNYDCNEPIQIKCSAKPRTISEVTQYFKDKGSNKKEGERFFYYYESQGWRVGKNPMKNWKMSASGWISRLKKDLPDSDYLNNQIKAMRE